MDSRFRGNDGDGLALRLSLSFPSWEDEGQTPCFAAEIGISARKGYAKDGVSTVQLPFLGKWSMASRTKKWSAGL